ALGRCRRAPSARGRRARGPRHLSPLHHLRQVALDAGGRRRLPRGRRDHDALLTSDRGRAGHRCCPRWKEQRHCGDRGAADNVRHLGARMTTALTRAAQRDIAHHLHPYTQLRQLEREGPLVIVRGDGVHVIDEQGRRYIDGMAGLWCASLGFSESRLADAAARQMKVLPYYHTFTGKVPGPVTELVEVLTTRWAPIPNARVL